LDVCRLNPAQGLERPGSGPLGKMFDEQLRNPPPGVQVWSACMAEQFSYEDSFRNNSFFLDKLLDALPAGSKGSIQRADDPLPLETLADAVNRGLKVEMERRQKEPVSPLSGKEAEAGAAYRPTDELPPPPGP